MRYAIEFGDVNFFLQWPGMFSGIKNLLTIEVVNLLFSDNIVPYIHRSKAIDAGRKPLRWSFTGQRSITP